MRAGESQAVDSLADKVVAISLHVRGVGSKRFGCFIDVEGSYGDLGEGVVEGVVTLRIAGALFFYMRLQACGVAESLFNLQTIRQNLIPLIVSGSVDLLLGLVDAALMFFGELAQHVARFGYESFQPVTHILIHSANASGNSSFAQGIEPVRVLRGQNVL